MVGNIVTHVHTMSIHKYAKTTPPEYNHQDDPRVAGSCWRDNLKKYVGYVTIAAWKDRCELQTQSSITVDTVVLLSSLLTEADVSCILLSMMGTLPPTVSSVFLFGLSRIMKHLGANIQPNKP